MIRRRYEYLVRPRASRFFRIGFALRLLRFRWRSIALAFLFIAGPMALAMWVVPHSSNVLIKVKGLDANGFLSSEECGVRF